MMSSNTRAYCGVGQETLPEDLPSSPVAACGFKGINGRVVWTVWCICRSVNFELRPWDVTSILRSNRTILMYAWTILAT